MTQETDLAKSYFHFDPAGYPATPGCFLMKDASGRALLAGGTVNLRSRLAQLFEESALPPPKTRVSNRMDDRLPRLAPRVRSIEVFLLPGSDDCPALANSLIERFHPLFNLATYLEPTGASYITQTAEEFPRFIPSQSPEAENGQRSFGPFLSHPRVLLLKVVNDALGLRTCHPMPRKACISYQLKLCSAPCEGKISKADYAARAARAAQHLAAPGGALLEMLQTQAKAAVDAQEFERARRINNQIRALKPELVKLAAARRAMRGGGHDQDAVYIAQRKAIVVCVRRGAIRDMQFLDAPGDDAAAFLREHYRACCPRDIFVNLPLPDPTVLAAQLSPAGSHAVTITLPRDAAEQELLEIARVNHAYRLNRLVFRSE